MARRSRRTRRPVRTERQVLAEASSPALDMFSAQIDDDDNLYRRLTGSRGSNLPDYTQEKMLSVARYLARVNPVASRILTLLSDFVLGEGVEPSVSSAAVAEVVDRHWQDRTNAWDTEMPRRFRRFLKTGEYLMPLFVNPVNGHVRVGAVPSDRIKAVHTDPENWERVTEVELRPRPGESDGVRYTVVNGLEASELAGIERPALWWTFGNDDGERGISILYPIADYLDALDQFMFSEVERWLLLKAFVWDVTLKGADQSEVDQRAKMNAYQTPAPGQVLLHNDQEEWQAKSPALDTHDAANGIRLIRNHALGAVGIPEHWFAEGGDVNRATASEMAEAPRKRLTALQELWHHMLMDVLTAVCEYAVLHDALPAELPVEDEDGNPAGDATPVREHVELNMPDISPDDQQVMAGVLATLETALVQAEDSGHVSPVTARRAFLIVLQQMGVDFDMDREIERIQQAEQDRETERQRDAERLYQQAPQPPNLSVLPGTDGAQRETGTD